MYKKIVEELGYMHGALIEAQPTFYSATNALGGVMVSGFNADIGNIPNIKLPDVNLPNVSGLNVLGNSSNTSNSSENIIYIDMTGAYVKDENNWTSRMKNIAENVINSKTPKAVF
jgi:hypothetical protein